MAGQKGSGSTYITSRMSVTLPALGPLVLQILLLTCDVHAQGRSADDSW